MVTKNPKEPKQSNQEEKDLVGIPLLFDLGKVENIKRSQPDGYGNTLEAFKNQFGLVEKDYRKLSDIANKIIEHEPYSSYTSTNFIEDHLFDWIIDTYQNNKAETEPLNYLQNEFEKDLNEYNFYFKIHALGIEAPFKIGNVEFIFFTDEVIKEHCKKFIKENPEKSVEECEFLFKEFRSKPIAKITAKGTQKGAKQNAQKQVNLSIDLLKCFLIQDSVISSTKLMDVEYRFTDTYPNSYIYESKSENFDFNSAFERTVSVAPVSLDSRKVKQLFDSGMDKISEFISKKPKNELTFIINRVISKIGEYSSENNLHERVIKIISLYEFLFIPVTKGKGKGQTIIKSRVLTKIIGDSERPTVIKIFNEFYDIRDKYLHNGLEKHIDINDLFKVQKITLFLLKRLVELNKNLKSSEELLDHFEIKNRL